MGPEDIQTLVGYQRWAMDRLFRPVRKLTPDQLHASVGLSHDSVLGTLVHVVDTQWYWRLGCQQGMLPSDRLAVADFASADELRAHWRQEQSALEDYTRSLSRADLNGQAEYRWPQARPRSRTRWHLLMHIITHGTHHRSEIGAHLATLDRSPGDLDFIIYVAKHA
jgi:uncharacterized damage-inducible protein DinB